ncbi:TAT-variant-translocated molybdopterin oxidoreductase [Verrucomicrobiaceae bacterium 227]
MSKRVWNPPIAPQEGDTVTAWRSVGEKEGSTTFRNHLDKEFPNGDTLTEEEQKVSRRSFTKLMGASSALAGLGLASCRRPESYIVPFKKAPEWVIPGKPLFYASTRPRVGGAVPLVVTTFEGRPTKLEPNTDHPDSAGTDALTQASILDLYSPSRSQKVRKGNQVATLSELKAALQGLDLATTAIVVGADDSPTRNRLAKGFAAKGATLISYEPLTGEALDVNSSHVVDFSKANRVLSLDCDFLGMDPIGNSRTYAAARQGGNANYDQEKDVDKDKMNRLYQVETQFSLTGGLADHRLRVAPSRVALIARALYSAITKKGKPSISEADKLAAFPVTEENIKADKDAKATAIAAFDQWIAQCAADLEAAGSEALVLAGSRQTKEVKALAAALNAHLQSAAIKTVQSDLGQYGSLAELTAKLEAGSIKNVILLTPANPVYDADGFAASLEKAEVSIHWGLRKDATAWACDWHVPAAHYLESWADARTETGILSLIQPMILPLYGGVSELELLHVLGGGDFAQGEFSPAMGEVKTTFAELTGKSDDEAWMEALMNGFAEGTAYEVSTSEVAAPAETELPAAPTAKSLEVVFATDASVYDGRYIDNAWLQEAPDPITKQTWDNSAQVSPQTAKDLGIYDRIIKLETANAEEAHTGKNGKPGEGENARAPFVLIKVGDRELKIPVLIAFGQADNTIVIPLGYGQAADDGRSGAVAFDKKKAVVGHVGLNTGFNGYQLRTAETQYSAVGATLETTTEYYKIALTQEHNSMYGRALAREISTNDLDGKGDYSKQLENVAKQGMDSHAPPNISLYKPEGGLWSKTELAKKTHLADEIHQWGMAIDLNTCTGCNACLVACQAENNIPVVGKDQVAMGREMHWIRMDRYFASQQNVVEHGHVNESKENPAWVTENPESIPQPVACVQCEMAPCETVCPVNATVHTEEGLNSMAYNRCIGTRYCANNCPYKARRFNFFDYNKRNPLIKGNLYKGPFGEKKVGDAPHLQRNPNVSVRMRGVMEKCTYCVQRLESAKIKQKQQQKHNTLASGVKSTAVAVDRAKDLRVKTDSVKTACQDACPTSAVTFGNLLDLKSKVVAAKGNELDSIKIIMGDDYVERKGSLRNYDLLNYINTRPRTSYLARVKNPNDKMPDAKFLGQATINLH